MEKNVGRKLRFVGPWDKREGTAVRDDPVHEIVGVQRIFDGTLAYRVVNKSDVHRFGRPVAVRELHKWRLED